MTATLRWGPLIAALLAAVTVLVVLQHSTLVAEHTEIIRAHRAYEER